MEKEKHKLHHKAHHEHHEEHHEHEKKHHRRGGGGIFQWWRGFMIGGTTGLLLSLLVAPQSGEQTRDLLRYKSVQLKHAAEQTAAEAKEKASNLTKDARMQVQTLKQRGQEFVDEKREQATRVASAVKDTWQEETQGGTVEHPLVETGPSRTM